MGDFRLGKCASNKLQKTLEDRISLLPEEILTRIVSFLTLKEAGRTSVVSKALKNAWTYVPELDFNGLAALREMGDNNYRKGLEIERPKFVKWVNKVLDSHHKPSELNSFRICIDLNYSFQDDLDKWV
ncbi:OLC1v1008788C1 [Oldenlandia corymbosa var. corymbosa]|uniref:OLC1v1008788C1 n=1 Tax=Oldenlandia corymbosa var. corymbosa TaxID=529605 RepID=A0AAV1DPU3_OLDCO|nr:OLC1v1008788C1 [Oldenlandia corymbosa var. corymbosa]